MFDDQKGGNLKEKRKNVHKQIFAGRYVRYSV